jgi:hypothetical protein
MLLLNRAIAVAFLMIGVALIIETAALGGRGFRVGYLAGVVFIALGLLRRRAARLPRR